jgi:hypothetical protein
MALMPLLRVETAMQLQLAVFKQHISKEKGGENTHLAVHTIAANVPSSHNLHVVYASETFSEVYIKLMLTIV